MRRTAWEVENKLVTELNISQQEANRFIGEYGYLVVNGYYSSEFTDEETKELINLYNRIR